MTIRHVCCRLIGLAALAGLILPSHRAPATDFEVISNSYGELELLGGLGQVQDDLNGWHPAMEGAQALAVEFSTPHMTIADWSGNLFVADKDAHAIRRIAVDGAVHTIAGINSPGNGPDANTVATNVALDSPNGLYLLPDGTLYILDFKNDKIRRLDTNGWMTTILTDPLGITSGRGLWVSPDEARLVYSSGTVIRQWSALDGLSTLATGFTQLGNLAVDPTDGSLAATDRGGHRVYRVATNGTKTVIAGSGIDSELGDGGPATNAGLNEVRGIAFAPHGGYFLCTHDGGNVWYVDTGGLIHLLIDGDTSSTPLPYDQIAEPRAITLAPNGDLIITESDYGIIRCLPHRPTITGAQVVSNGFALTWSSMPDRTSHVERAVNLLATNWVTIAAMAGNPSTIETEVVDTNAPVGSTQFYRMSD
ncbi:MAG: hypothetical protein O3A51_04145 [Verrucomicrobia bacterium]|nr:hypothetical protein [Verrucomicrobiota bacterium]